MAFRYIHGRRIWFEHFEGQYLSEFEIAEIKKNRILEQFRTNRNPISERLRVKALSVQGD